MNFFAVISKLFTTIKLPITINSRVIFYSCSAIMNNNSSLRNCRKVTTGYPHAHNDQVICILQDLLSTASDDDTKQKLSRALDLTEGLEDYLIDTASSPGLLTERIIKDTLTEPWAQHYANGLMSYSASTGMLSGPYEGSFLKSLAVISRAERILEVGMFTGGSAAAFCASPFSKECVTLDTEPFLEQFIKSRFAGTYGEPKLRVMTGQALDSLAKLKTEGAIFDLVFIDADKPNYPNYYNFIMDNNLLSQTGTIAVDNVLWKGEVYPKPSTERGQLTFDFNAMVAADPRVNQIILPIRDGVMLIMRNTS